MTATGITKIPHETKFNDYKKEKNITHFFLVCSDSKNIISLNRKHDKIWYKYKCIQSVATSYSVIGHNFGWVTVLEGIVWRVMVNL